ncbi:hypothetical protein MSAN_00567400 [Mycena sanguinolenta]|uniref:Uncharacterized protein n=1 Tax=Mycena sanguinolenta TaxID=230812 RepID=A0A8H7DGK3_9AGAR|nr:hypothetical protein MSAN_00567400 [Mycena sanguinolenta]
MAGGPTISIDNSGLIATPYTPATTIEGRLADLRQFIQNRLPGTAGIHPVRAEDLVVYYDRNPKCASRIDLGNASEEDLAALANACDTGGQTASGRTMDSTKFATRFDVVTSGLIDMISGDVLQGENVDKSLRAELSHMNVYGSGECGEPQQNISHRDSMIGSLAVIFPTVHAGGRLTISHENTPLFYDSSTALSAAGTSAVTYLALYDKVSSTMAPIDNGYRIELVYNLSLMDRDSAGPVGTPMIHNPSATERLLEDRIQDLLAHPNFLPVGGFLAVGLVHKYAMPSPVAGNESGAHYENGRLVIPQTPARWDSVLKSLKGIDARMRTVFQRIGLTPSVKLLYSDPEERDDVLLDEIADLFGTSEDFPECGSTAEEDEEIVESVEGSVTQVVHWLTDLGDKNQVHTAYIEEDGMCGDKPGTAVLIIPVPAFGDGPRGIMV